MAAIQTGNGQDVHYCQNNADEGRELPESEPVPCFGEYVTYGNERAHRLGTFGTGHILEVVDISGKGTPTLLQTCRDTGKEGV